jgi:hypothetical protein
VARILPRRELLRMPRRASPAQLVPPDPEVVFSSEDSSCTSRPPRAYSRTSADRVVEAGAWRGVRRCEIFMMTRAFSTQGPPLVADVSGTTWAARQSIPPMPPKVHK